MIENQQRQNYQYMVNDKNRKISKQNEKINQLEEVEKLLVEKLGMTQMNQHQALANLHKVVQICNSGLNYDQIKQGMKGKKLNVNSNSNFSHKYKTI